MFPALSHRFLAAGLLLSTLSLALAQAPFGYQPPDLASISSGISLQPVLQRYAADERSLRQFYDQPFSPLTDTVLRNFYTAWREALEKLDFNALAPEARIDFILLRNKLGQEIHELDLARNRIEEMSALIPFGPAIVSLQEARQRVDPVQPDKAAATLAQMARQIDELAKQDDRKPKPVVASRAARAVGALRDTLKRWFQFYDGYDPMFRWWVADPYKQVDESLNRYATHLREKLAGIKKDDRDTILGDPIGRQALLAELAFEMIPYTPEELVAIAEKEFAWCDAEMLRASRELGFGDDWRRAIEHVKTLHMPPGQQPALIREQAREAIEYIEKRGLVTVPALASQTWRMDMMTPEQQRINPFFTGGELINVSYPTDGMSHEQKLMSMRGNNIHFSRATVFHELIPGHYLQRFMSDRHLSHRRVFRTPFWGEGWALHWEMLLWDLGFPQTPENRIGMLFWRMHRCARIIFSLSFHLEKMTAAECVDYLVNRVGHERENAAAEVRRSFETDYAPLYQSAYMLGALQFRALHKELVGGGKMTNREFHDRILKANSMPVEMVRASLTSQPPAKNFSPGWKFYGGVQPAGTAPKEQ